MRAAWDLLVRLLFDQRLRAAFEADRAAVILAAGLSPADAARFMALDAEGLRRDAEGRALYLMSALCRPFPLSSAVLGAAPGGVARLREFLASPALFGPLGARSVAFGAHLAALTEHFDAPDEARGLLDALLSLERALVQNAAALREAAGLGRAPGPPKAPSPKDLRKGRLSLPPFLLVAELPTPLEQVVAALDGVGPEDAWHRILSGGLRLDRFVTVARADPQPVTLLFRGYVAGQSVERAGSGGVAPLVDVRHARAELSGTIGPLLSQLREGPRLDELAPARQELAKKLAEAGLIAVG